MNSRGFSFPPPPPPSSQQQHHPTYPPAAQYGQRGHGQRGGRQKSRGRGFGNRGGRVGHGGNYCGAPDTGHHLAYSANATSAPPMGYPPMDYTSFASQPLHSPANVSPSSFLSSRSPDFRHPSNPPAYGSPQALFPQSAAAPMESYPHRTDYETGYNGSGSLQQSTPYHQAQTPPTFPAVVPPPQPPPHSQAPMMGPPMRWGFENTSSPTSFHGVQRGHTRGPRSFNSYGNHASDGDKTAKYGNKRDYSSTFGKPQSRIPAPPPVPSFGNPLPLKPPAPVDASRKPKKKKRRYNQLGLTPKTEEHESSEEEDDADEEARLASSVNTAAAPLQFSYKGRTSILRTPSDIAAWIEERKKRFPTQARVEEKKEAMEQAKKARDEALKQKELRRQEAKKQQENQTRKEREKQDGRKKQQAEPADPVDAAERAKRKAEKLRRKLLRGEKKVAKAEEDAERARLKVVELKRGSMEAGGLAQPEPVRDKISELPAKAVISNTPDAQVDQDDMGNVDGVTSPAASDALESSDWTSSSGSSDLSSSESEESDDDSAPEEVTSRREGPERVPPQPREGKKRLCRHFAKNGRCQRGTNCKFSHEMPERKVKMNPVKNGRKGLLQAVGVAFFFLH